MFLLRENLTVFDERIRESINGHSYIFCDLQGKEDKENKEYRKHTYYVYNISRNM